jgi:hydrogenase expression/formation protein HypD
MINQFRFRDRKYAEKIAEKIKSMHLKARFMHVCGTHQDTLVKYGLDEIFREGGIEIGQGPGCPVCVTTPVEIEEGIKLAKEGKVIATYGDLLRVPGEKESLLRMRTDGFDIRVVYSIDNALDIALKNPNKEVVFMAIGFETTAPSTANVLLKNPPENFSILNCHRRIPPVLKALIEMGEIEIDGFIEPGHVSTIIGAKPYEFISKQYKVPQVIAGFEPLDLLMGVLMLAKQVKEGRAEVENEYQRAVTLEGNKKALDKINKVFAPKAIQWRGFPLIPNSYLALKSVFEAKDASIKYEDELAELKEREFKQPKGCRCDEVLRGLITPEECPLFGKKCDPMNPIGPCMVSFEGSCQIEYKWRKKKA